MNQADVQAAFAATLIDEWARWGVTDAVVAPGSRSTPVLAALVADGRLRLHLVLDERSAGFVALGLGAASGKPAVVVTTSGTAAVELHPAVVEAHHAGVPLLAVTADRPVELHGVAAPQTVEQAGLFAGAVRLAVGPGVADGHSREWWRPLAARVAAATTVGPAGPGPVHLNLAFREPLLAADAAGTASLVPAGRPGERAWHDAVGPEAPVPPARVIAELAGAGGRGLIVAGAGAGDPAALLAAAEATGWPLLAEPRSGARIPHPAVVAAADSLLRCPPVGSWRPDVVLRVGRPWASKVLGQWLAGLPASTHQVLVDPWGEWADPERRVATVVRADPTATSRALAAAAGGAGGGTAWSEAWRQAERAAQAALDGVITGVMTEPAVARALVRALPAGATLVASSSMPVRDVEWFGAPREGLRFLSNRGANGIDGVTSTATGVALARPASPTYALLGDLAFLYDATALMAARRTGADLTLVVVDNDGGGIFSFLPQAQALPGADFERLWGTPHGQDLAALAAGYGVPASTASSPDELAEAVSAPPAGLRVVLVGVPTRAANVDAHASAHAAVERRLRPLAGRLTALAGA